MGEERLGEEGAEDGGEIMRLLAERWGDAMMVGLTGADLGFVLT